MHNPKQQANINWKTIWNWVQAICAGLIFPGICFIIWLIFLLHTQVTILVERDTNREKQIAEDKKYISKEITEYKDDIKKNESRINKLEIAQSKDDQNWKFINIFRIDEEVIRQ